MHHHRQGLAVRVVDCLSQGVIEAEGFGTFALHMHPRQGDIRIFQTAHIPLIVSVAVIAMMAEDPGQLAFSGASFTL